MIQLRFTNLPVDEIHHPLLIVPYFEDVRPLKGNAGWLDWRFNGKLSRFILQARISGVGGECLLMPGEGRIEADELLLVGIGKKEKLNESEIQSLIEMILDKIIGKKAHSFALSFSDGIPDLEDWMTALLYLMRQLIDHSFDCSVSLVEPLFYLEEVQKRQIDWSEQVSVYFEKASLIA